MANKPPSIGYPGATSDPFASQAPYMGFAAGQNIGEEYLKGTQGMYRPSAGAFGTPGGSAFPGLTGSGSWGARGFWEPERAGYWRSQQQQGMGQAGSARGTQEDMLNYLSALAKGQLPPGQKSLSQLAQQSALQRIQSQATAARRGARSPAEARAALYQEGAAEAKAAQTGAAAGLAEQRAAQQAAMTGAGAMRGQDIQTALAAQKGLMTEAQIANMKKATEAKYLSLGLSDREARRRAQIDLEKIKLMAWEGQQGRASAKDLLKYQMEQEMMGGAISGGIGALGALLAAFSDKRGKTNIKPSDDVANYVTSCAGAKDYDDTENFMDDPAMAAGSTPSGYARDLDYQQMQRLRKGGSMAPDSTLKADMAKTKASEAPTKEQKAAGGLLGDIGKMLFGGQRSEPAGMKASRNLQAQHQQRMANFFDSIASEDMSVPSDERIKNIEEFMDKMKAVKFRYKNPEKHGRGERTGVLAQDVEKSKLGSGMVIEDEEGMKHLDISPQKFNPLVLASLADLNKRLNRVEGK